jgi:hypothetical protein
LRIFLVLHLQMSDTLPSTSQDLPPHRRRLNSSSTISAIRHVQFRRPTVDYGRKGKKWMRRKDKSNDFGTADEKSEVSLEENIGVLKKITWKQRIRHFTWTWFTMTMATGGIANVMYVSFTSLYEYEIVRKHILMLTTDTLSLNLFGCRISTLWELFSSS